MNYILNYNNYNNHNNRKKKLIRKAFIIILSALMLISLVGCGKKKEEDEEEYVRASVIGDIDEDTLKLSPNGTLLEISCEDFSNSDIDVSGLEAYINSEIDSYNEKAGVSKISLVEYQEQDGVVKTAIQFSDIATYNSFNMMKLDINLFDAKVAEDVIKKDMATETDATQIVMTASPTEINVEELAEAGYDLSEIEAMENGTYDDETASETDADATFTDAVSLDEIKVKDVSGASYMMLITDEASVYTINGGNILYYSKHAEQINSSTVRTDGTGKTVIIYNFNY